MSSSSTGSQGTTVTPTPSISSINPAKLSAGAATTTVTVTGSGFISGSAVQVGGINEPTTYVSATSLTVTVPASQLASGSQLSIVVSNGTSTSLGTQTSLEVDNPTPVITSLSSTVATVGGGSLVVLVVGTGFVPTTTIAVNGSPRGTTYINSTQVSVALPATDFGATGTLSLTAVNPTPVGGTSSAASIAVNDPAPAVQALSPAVLDVGTTTATTVTVSGSGFIPGSSISVSGAPRATTFVSGTTLTFVATVADQAKVATLPITVTNAAPGGGTSGIFNLYVISPPPTPVITSLNPSSLVINTTPASFVVSGTGFNPTSVVQWNGTDLPTSFSYSNNGTGFVPSLTAVAPPASLGSAGTASITVKTPYANPQISNSVTMNIVNPPVPILTSLSPSTGPINMAAAVTLFGSGFTTNTTVAVNGQTVASTYKSSTVLTATFPASDLASLGNVNVTVTTPAPGGGTSTPLAFSTYINIPNNSMVYDPGNGLFYLSVPSSAGAPYGNSVVSVDPLTGTLGTPIPVGSEPNQLAISSDGSVLWVGLDGASAVRQVNLTTNTAGMQFSLGGNAGVYATPPTALALAVLPGLPNSVVVSRDTAFSQSSVAIFDSGVLRGSAYSTALAPTFYALAVNGTKSEIYAAGGGYQTFTYDATGLKPLATGPSGLTYAGYNTNEMQIAGGVLFTDNGQAFDAESGNLLGTFYSSGTTVAAGPVFADPTLGLAFVLDTAYTTGSAPGQILSFNLANYASSGKSAIPVAPVQQGLYTTTVTHLTRWGTNGLAYRNSLGFYSLRSNLVKDLSSVNADLGVALTTSGGTATGTNATYTATVTNNGPSASTNIALTASLPSTGVLVSATPSTGTCTTGSTVSCDLGGLANGSSDTVTFVVGQQTAGTASMTVQVSGSETDSNTSNNTASASITVTGSTYNPTPTLSAISPAAIQSGSSGTTITVTGTGFTSASTVLLGGTALTTSYTNATTLSATVPQASLASLGWAPITVSNATPGGGVSNPLPLSVFNVITLGVNHILYDPFSRKIMASIGSGSATVTGNSIAAIDPTTGSVGTPVPIGSQPTNLALTSDGQVLYTTLVGSQSIGVYNMLTQATEFTYQVQPTSGTNTSPAPRGIATQPGSDTAVVIDLGSWSGNALYNFDLTNKTAAMVGQATGPYSGTCLTFLDASDMLAFDADTSGATLDHYKVTSAGFTYYNYSQYSTSTLKSFGCFKLSGGLAFANGGGVANPATVPATQLGVLSAGGGGTFSTVASFVPDTSLGEAFYLANTQSSSSLYSGVADGIQSYNLSTFMPSSQVSLNMETIEGSTSYSGVDMIRWGQDGLAVLTSGGHIYLMRGGFVVPQEMQSNAAASLTSSSASTLTHGSGNTMLTLTGSNFIPGVAVTWNGSYRTTTILDATHVSVAIPASDLATAGSASLVATNPGAQASNTLQLTIN
ncbi:MAG: IPT/TIG domain-containing protein [Acidobacteriota bacterium]|nr:IPT/TIG domain-containing protein [Acidobacteriota bacterium]